MNRRSFFRHFGGLVAAVAVAQGVVKKLVTEPVTTFTTTEFVFKPEDYTGDWQVVQLDRHYSTKEIDAAYGEWRKMSRTYVIWEKDAP